MNNLPHTRTMHVFHGETFYADPKWKTQLAEIGLSPDKDWTTLTSDESVSASYTTTNNYRFTLSDDTAVYFKRYVYRKTRLKYWLQPAKAAVEVAGFYDLEKLGIDTIQPIAYGEKRQWGFLKASFIVTVGLPNTTEMGQYLARVWFKMPFSGKYEQLTRLQPILIGQLQLAHQAGFFHWDLKLRNILLQKENDTEKLIWIDCPRSRIKNPNNREAIIKDLAAMARVGVRVLTSGQQLRFLLKYTRYNKQAARALYRDVGHALSKNPPRPYWHLLSHDDPVFIAEREKMKKVS